MAMRIRAETLRDFCTRVLVAAGVPEAGARIAADCMVAADLRGVHSHGAMRLPVYYKRLRAKLVEPNPAARWVAEGPSAALYDAGGGLGHPAGVVAVEKAIEMARATGIGAAGVRNSSHFGMAGYYLLRPMEEGFLAVVTTNSAPRMAPWGGRRPVLGTNPLAIGVPSRLDFPLMLDMATSVVAIGKVALAAKEGRPVPEGWGLDAEGNPTTDPQAIMAGSIKPMAGPKGSGLSFMLDVLAGVLTGAAVGADLKSMFSDSEKEQSGHFFLAIDISAFGEPEAFYDRLDRLVAMVRESGSPGERVYLPGEIEGARQKEYAAKGIPFEPAVVDELYALAAETKCAWHA